MLALQALALKCKSRGRHFSLDLQMEIVRAHLSEGIPALHLCKKFGISRTTFYKWISKFASGKLLSVNSGCIPSVEPRRCPMPKKKVVSEADLDELVRLREENRRLSEALKMSEWMNHAKDVMIDEAEKAFNIPIRKKSGAKQ